MRREVSIGEVVVCVKSCWGATVGRSYMVIDKHEGVAYNYYSIIDDTGKLSELLYKSNDFLPITEYRKVVAIK